MKALEFFSRDLNLVASKSTYELFQCYSEKFLPQILKFCYFEDSYISFQFSQKVFHHSDEYAQTFKFPTQHFPSFLKKDNDYFLTDTST